MKKYVSGLFLLLAVACTNYNEEELYPADTCELEAVSYSLTVSHTLMHNCLSCHSTSFPSGGVILDNYNEVKKQALNGRLVGAISHAPGFHPMPQGGNKLPDCEIAGIKAWVEAGAPNN